MPQFEARWLEPATAQAPARLRQRRINAADVREVPALLGVAPMHLVSVRPLSTRWRLPLRWSQRPLPLRLFSQELAVLLDAGIPLLEALQTLREKDESTGDSSPLDVVIGALRDGLPVSGALARAPAHFDPLFIALVAASERSGQLAATLRQHAIYLAWVQTLAGQLRAALVYPLLLLGAGALVILFLLLYVLPRFAGVFDGLGRDLPLASRWLIDLGVLAAAHPGLSIAVAAAGPLLLVLASRWPALRRAVGAALWRSPGLGPRLRLVALARLYRALSLTLSAGVPTPAALALVGGVLPAALQPALQQVLQQVRSGQRLSASLQAQGLATPVAWRMLRVGESSGEVPAMLQRAAGFHDEEIARLSEIVTRLVNPVLMLVMGVVIGGIVVLMYLPIFTLMEQVQ